MNYQEELKYCYSLMELINDKLDNEKFMQKAPTNLIERERKKKLDVEQRIKHLKTLLKE